jgi:ribonuclease HI
VKGQERQCPAKTRGIGSASGVSDSSYLVNYFKNRWWRSLLRNDAWLNSKKEPVANRDIWEPLVRLPLEQDVAFRWVKGHPGHILNEAADRLAEEGRLSTGPTPLSAAR